LFCYSAARVTKQLVLPVDTFPIFFAVLGFELRTYTLSHSTNPFFVMGFFKMGVS
jgi:hypothetical protein